MFLDLLIKTLNPFLLGDTNASQQKEVANR
jgi:hypothetical protein